MRDRDQDLASRLRQAGAERGDLVGLVVAPNGTAAVAVRPGGSVPDDAVPDDAVGADAAGAPEAGWIVSVDEVAAADGDLRPRWVTWSGETAARLCGHGVRLSTSWDVAAVHRLLFGGWHAEPGLAWAGVRGLPADRVPAHDPGALFDAMSPGTASSGALSSGALSSGTASSGTVPGADDPVGPDGYLRSEWTDGGWAESDEQADPLGPAGTRDGGPAGLGAGAARRAGGAGRRAGGQYRAGGGGRGCAAGHRAFGVDGRVAVR